MSNKAELEESFVPKDEEAACLAAVYEYLRQEAQAEKISEDRVNSFAVAARLEACGLTGSKFTSPLNLKENLWKVSRSPGIHKCLSIAFLLGACFLTNLSKPAFAQDAPPVEQVPAGVVRVALALDAGKIILSAPDGAIVHQTNNGQTVADLPAHSQWQLTAVPGTLAFQRLDLPQVAAKPSYDESQSYNPQAIQKVSYAPHTFAPDQEQLEGNGALSLPLPQNNTSMPPAQANVIDGYVIVPEKQDGLIGVNGKFYRGTICVVPDPKSPNQFHAINVVDLEDYLLSVVPSEMPSSWPLEALKAQTVAARSYALANLGKHAADGYDLKASTDDQVYSGVSSESDTSNLAVAQTASIVIKYNGQIVPAFFHSSSGGKTDESTWGQPMPFLQSVFDYDDQAPLFTWSQNFTSEKLSEALASSGHRVGDLLDAEVTERTPSGKAVRLVVSGSDSSQKVSAVELQKILKLPSTNFNIGKQEGKFVVCGRGFGHGLGLSQWGAKALAEHGWNAAQILNYYYKDVTIGYW